MDPLSPKSTFKGELEELGELGERSVSGNDGGPSSTRNKTTIPRYTFTTEALDNWSRRSESPNVEDDLKAPSPVLLRLHVNHHKQRKSTQGRQGLTSPKQNRMRKISKNFGLTKVHEHDEDEDDRGGDAGDAPGSTNTKVSFIEEHMVLIVFLSIGGTVIVGILCLLTLASLINSVNYPGEDAVSYFKAFRDAEPAQIHSLLNVLVVVNSTVLVLVLEVTTILLQIAAARFSSVVFTFFFQSPRTMLLLAFFLFNNVNVIMIASVSGDTYQPRAELIICTLLTIICVVTLYPYFIDTFQITSAEAIIKKLGEVALEATNPLKNENPQVLNSNKHRAATAIERLANMGLNAVQQSDKMYACRVVNELSEIVLQYQEHKLDLPHSWHMMQQWNRENPDFFSLDSEGIANVVKSRTWLEWKVLRQYQMLFDHGISLKAYGECCLIAVNTRKICERCASVRDGASVVDLCIKFFNTFLRYAISAGDGRSCSNLLHQYRQAGEYLLYHHQYCKVNNFELQLDNENKEERPVMVTKYLAYYAELALKRNLGPITELCAHDLSSMCQLAYIMNSPLHDRILSTFLCVDDIASALQIETAVMGIRKAQIKLATTYMENGDEELAKQIQEDMAEDPPDRLRIVRRQLQDFNEKEFWEVGDRGTNVDYLKPEQQKQLQKFFGWFGPTFFDEDSNSRNVRSSLHANHLSLSSENAGDDSVVSEGLAGEEPGLAADVPPPPRRGTVKEQYLRSRHNSVLFPSTQRDSRMLESSIVPTAAEGAPVNLRQSRLTRFDKPLVDGNSLVTGQTSYEKTPMDRKLPLNAPAGVLPHTKVT